MFFKNFTIIFYKKNKRKEAVDLLAAIKNFIAQPQAVFCLRILLAMVCGAALGLERTVRSKEAGIRTHSILSGGAARFMILSKYAFFDLIKGGGLQGFDPTVIACYIIDGSGFLCAGIIFSKVNRDSISGMTTAAGVWGTVAIGMACGCGMVDLGITATLLLLLTHWILSRRGISVLPLRTLRLTIVNTPDLRRILSAARDKYGIQIVSARYSRSVDDNTISMLLKIRPKHNISFEDTLRFLDRHPEVIDISF